MSSPLRKDGALHWTPAAVQLPEMPAVPPGPDAMSATIAAVLPTLAAPLVADVTALAAREQAFAGKLGGAEAAYGRVEEAGQESIGQVGGIIGRLGQVIGQVGQQAGQQASAPAQAAGGAFGQFGSLMQQAMQAGGRPPTTGEQPAAAPAGAVRDEDRPGPDVTERDGAQAATEDRAGRAPDAPTRGEPGADAADAARRM